MSNLENVKEIVVQQVNCIGVMGAGIAKAIRQDITDADYAKYQNICKFYKFVGFYFKTF